MVHTTPVGQTALREGLACEALNSAPLFLQVTLPKVGFDLPIIAAAAIDAGFQTALALYIHEREFFEAHVAEMATKHGGAASDPEMARIVREHLQSHIDSPHPAKLGHADNCRGQQQ